MENITLSYSQGPSDKIYQAGIEKKGDGFVVPFAYGRRGSTLQTGYKTTSPVSYVKAKSILDRLIRGKLAKGYEPAQDMPAYQASAERRTGIHCQLLNPIGEKAIGTYLCDPEYWMQEKQNGRRLLLLKQNGVVTGINRLGLSVGIPTSLAEAALSLPGEFLIDGEAIGEVLYVFDILNLDGSDIRKLAYADRHLHLTNLLASGTQSQVRLVETAQHIHHKKVLFEDCLKAHKEGVVFKRYDAPYTSGRPATGGSQFKFKFCETASFIVEKINDKRSIGLMLRNGSKVVSVGNVTIPPNHDIPAPGAIVECRYLYAFPGGSIFQPVYLGQRDDIPWEECAISQLKYKPEAIAA
jgi:bifunctional non-homologous end joining protein LigD